MYKIVLLLVVQVCLVIMAEQSQAEIGPGNFSSYRQFDLEGGYEPGSVLKIKGNDISSVIIDINKLKSRIPDPSILEISANGGIPEYEFDKTQSFRASLEADIKKIPVELKSHMTKVEKVTLRVKDGSRQRFTNGSICLSQLIKQLSQKDLELIRDEVRLKNSFWGTYFGWLITTPKIVMVSEVLQYKEATAILEWGFQIDAEAKAKIVKVINIDASSNWDSGNKLTLKYKNNILVAYKDIEIDEDRIEVINAEIKKRQIDGDPITIYLDGDGDGYGNPMIKNVGYSKNIQAGYVTNGSDPDDADRNNFPGATRWYRDADADGYGDRNNFVYSLSRPSGYVADNRDCYDLNANAKPGQLAWFSQVRGDRSYDYDCDGQETKRWASRNGGCISLPGNCSAIEGWVNNIPTCGTNARWLDDCDTGGITNGFRCNVQEQSDRTQECR